MLRYIEFSRPCGATQQVLLIAGKVGKHSDFPAFRHLISTKINSTYMLVDTVFRGKMRRKPERSRKSFATQAC